MSDWIRCSERMPERVPSNDSWITYAVLVKGGYRFLAQYFGGGQWTVDNVIAWYPIPDSPAPEKGER